MNEGTARDRLRETIKALERGDYSNTKNEPMPEDQSIPWGMAYQVAVQREASRLPLPSSAPPRSKGPRHPGNHAGPASLLTRRVNPVLDGSAAPGSLSPDPFGRTAVGVGNPVELSWRSTVAHTQAARRANTSSLDYTTEPSAGQQSGPATATGTTAITTAADPSSPHINTQAQSTGGAAEASPQRWGARSQAATVPAGWAPGPGVTGSAPVLKEVPESFWRTIAPDVHHEMLEYLYDHDPDPQSRINAMIAALRTKQGVDIWTGLSNAKKAAERKEEGSLGTAAGVAVVLGLMNTVPREPGTPAKSRWYFLDGTSEWRDCNVVKASADGAVYAIRWQQTGGIKTVSRFNILFEGESASELEDLKKVALRQQKKLRHLQLHAQKISELPAFDAPPMSAEMTESIIQRVGGRPMRRKRLDSEVERADDPEQTQTVSAGGANPATTTQVYLDLHQADVKNKLGLSSPSRRPVSAKQGPSVSRAGSHAYTGWRLGLDEAWHKCVFPNAEARLQGALTEAAEEFAYTHNKLAYQAAFTRETGLQVPDKLDDLLAVDEDEPHLVKRPKKLGDTGTGQPEKIDPLKRHLYPSRKPAPDRATVQVVSDSDPSSWGTTPVSTTPSQLPARSSEDPEGDLEGDGSPLDDPSELQQAEYVLNVDPVDSETPAQAVLSRGSSASTTYHSARMELAAMAAPDGSLAYGGSQMGSRGSLRPGSGSRGGTGGTPLGPLPPLLEDPDTPGVFRIPGQVGTPPAAVGFELHADDSPEQEHPASEAAPAQPPNRKRVYNAGIYQLRAGAIRRHALIADGALLKAWQNSVHYLSDIQRRDAFGLKQLPLCHVYHCDPDHHLRMLWRRYLDSRKPSASVLAPGTGSAGHVSIVLPGELQAQPSVTVLKDTVHLVELLNVMEGARVSELLDLRHRVIAHLALIVVDAAQEALTASVDDWEMPVPPPEQLHKYGNFPSLDPAVRAALAARAARGNGPEVRFDQDSYYRLASLLNVALFDTLRAWLTENIRVYATGIKLYSSPFFTGAPLFDVVLDAIGEEIKFTPALELLESRLLEAITISIQGVNSLPGLQVVPRAVQPGVPVDASTLPFDVLPQLEMPTLLTEHDPEVKRSMNTIRDALGECQRRCAKLVHLFSKHLGLLSLDARSLRAQLGPSRSAMKAEDWSTAIAKYRSQWDDIVENLPIEVDMGLIRIKCVALQRRLAERAERLASTLLLTLQEDGEELANTIVNKLQPLWVVLTQPLTDLGAVHAVKEAAREAPDAILELYRHGVQLRWIPEVLHTFKHQVPEDIWNLFWKALQLPARVEEAVFLFTASMAEHEDLFLARLKQDREDFAAEIAALAQKVQGWSVVAQEELMDEYVALANTQLNLIKQMMAKGENINKQEVLAGWETTSYASLHILRRQLQPYLELWKLVKSFKEYYHQWMYGPLFAFDMELCETSVPAWTRLTTRLAKDLSGPPQAVAQKYSTYLMDFEGQLPLLRALRTQGLRQRHWNRIHAEVPTLATLDKSQLTLHTLLQAGMHRHVAVLRELADLAARELVIEQAVMTISTAFMALRIAFTQESESGIPDMYVLTNGNDLIKFMDDAQLRIKGLSTSVYVDPHKESVIQWDEALGSIRNVLEMWLEVQARWGHLAPLFGPSGLSSQLPLEARRFMDVTREWRKTINAARSHCQLSELLRHSELPTLLGDFAKGLEGVHKGVMEFLEEKRGNFPRFYFLSNNEMVNVLVRSHDPTAVEPYLGRCFPGIGKLALSREWGVRIEGLISPESEQLLLRQPVDLVDYASRKGVDVEVWMMALEKHMRMAMRETLKSALDSLVSQAYEQWLISWPAQAILLSGALVWCRDVTECFKAPAPYANALQRVNNTLGSQVLRVVGLMHTNSLSALQRSVLENVIIVKVYQRDVLSRLGEGRIEGVDDIEWLRVMRFYQEGEVVIRVGYSQISYGQEYLGNSPRLVITPLTERAFSSLVTAVHLHYGGAPEGPAGTGKTETVKELSRGVAKQCIVFNTTEQLDVSHMTRLLMGIASTGAWSCFDEFNRMDMEVLSVVAKQIMTIQAALSAGERYFMFDGRNLGINNTLAMFITMNPSYEFRNMLPSNLKALFRPVAMMVPDYRLIAEVQLYAAGFQTAGMLAAHLVSVLKIASHRLSSQAHYDFAMRTLKSVLLIAAQLRTAEAGRELSPDDEASLVRVALLRCNMSKLRIADAQIFMAVVDREFPQPGSADQFMGTLKEHVRTAAAVLKVQATDELITRCLQTYSMLQIRTGVMLLGPAACGKSTVISVLAGALSAVDQTERGVGPVALQHVFPKAVSSTRLYGLYNTATQTWEDGVLTAALRVCNTRDALNRAWVVLDGPVDHIWVEALNPVLDDNRTLCLSSGESIPLRQGVNLIMEVDSIAMASPATVSRCGMVYLGAPNSELWAHQIQSWCKHKLPPVLQEYASKIDATVTLIFNELIKAYTDSMEADSMTPRQQPNGILQGLLRLLHALMVPMIQKVVRDLPEREIHACLESAMLMALVWAFEACLPAKARAFFNILVRQMCARTIKYNVTKFGETTECSSTGFQIPMPADGQVFDFMFDFEQMRWISWKDYGNMLLDPVFVANMGPDAFVPFGLPSLTGSAGLPPSVRHFVFTADNLPALFLLRLLLSTRANVVLMGTTGTGKSALVNALLDSADDWMPAKEDIDEPDDPWRASITGGSSDAGSRPGSAAPRSSSASGAGQPAPSLLEDGNSRKRNALTILPLTLSSQSTATNTRTTIQSYILKRRKGVLGPPVGKVAVMFVDDLSSAGRDKFGTQGAVELLRQWCALGGWHDELKATFTHVADSQLVGCITTTQFQKPVSDRFLQYVSLVGLPPISHSGFTLIFTAVLKRYMSSNTTLTAGLLPALVGATMELYRHITGYLVPSPSRPHYLFSIRHVGTVFKSMFHAHRRSRTSPVQLVRLWQHECCRVFHDRIVDEATRSWFNKIMQRVTDGHLGEYLGSGVPAVDANDVTFVTFASHGGSTYEQAEYVLQADRAPLTPESLVTEGLTPEVTPRTAAAMSSSGVTRDHSPFKSDGQAGPLGATPSITPNEVTPRPGSSHDLARQHISAGGPRKPGNPADGTLDSPPGAPSSPAKAGKLKGMRAKSLQAQQKPASPVASAEALVAGGLTGPESLPLPPPPESVLMKLYANGWVDDGSMTREEAVQARLTEIAAQHASEYLASHSISSLVGPAATETTAATLGSGLAPDGGLVVFKTALMHLARITRILSMEQGHLILVGPHGAGRRTLARLACHMSKVTPFEANLKDGQKGFIWHDMLKNVMHTAGVLGRPACLLLVDVGRPADSMLDDVSHLMASAYLPGLFKQEEAQTIIKSLKPVARAAGIQWSEIDRTGASDAVLQKFFVDRCRANLHVLMVLEQHDANLQRLIVAFPKMFHLATINVVDDWDHEAREQVAKSEFGSAEALLLEPTVYEDTITACSEIHDVAKQISSDYTVKAGGRSVCYVTSCQYLRLLHHIKQALPHKRAGLRNDREKYMEGVTKMVDMTARLKTLQDKIAAMQPKLQERQAEASQLMAMIQDEKAEAEAALAAIIPEEEQAALAAEKKGALVAECEAELDKVMPPLIKALKELRAIDKASIAELKVMKSPPEGVKLVMRAICIMLGTIPSMVTAGKIKDETMLKKAWWEESIRVLGDFHFLDALLLYDKDAMTEEMTCQIAAFTEDPQFDPAVVARSSQSAAVLAKWVIAMGDYQRVKKVVDPKRDALKLAEHELAQQEDRLAQARKRLADINATIQEQEKRYAMAVAAQEALAADIEAAQRRVGQAQKVLNAVRKEVERWTRNAEASDLRHQQVLGEALLSAGYFAYLGPLPGSYRLQAEAGWCMSLQQRGIPLAPGFSLAESMGEPAMLDTWRDAGLPQSRTAVENALVMEHSPQWALLVDPQELGNAYLRGYYGGDSSYTAAAMGAPSPLAKGQMFLTADQSDLNFKDTILRAIETGAVLLLENLDEDMDDIIEQVLQQNTFHNQRGELCIKLGESSAVFNPRFRMFVTTRLRSPKFPFNVVRHMAICNFSITKAQLGELLITATLKHEMPELEAEHGALIKQKAKNAMEIMNLEDQVLMAINTTSTEALLEESEVYSVLVALQDSAASIKAKVGRIEESQRRINDVRSSIDKHFVSRVSVFFFVLQDMALVRHTYQFSLRWFSNLFRDALASCPRSNTGRERLESLTLHFAGMLYTGAAMSLFDEDKRPFAALLLTRYMLASGLCSKEEANLLLFGRSEQGKPSLAKLTEGNARRGAAGGVKRQDSGKPAEKPPAAASEASQAKDQGADSGLDGMFKGAPRKSRLAKAQSSEPAGGATKDGAGTSDEAPAPQAAADPAGSRDQKALSAEEAVKAEIEERKRLAMLERLANDEYGQESDSAMTVNVAPKAGAGKDGKGSGQTATLMAPGSMPDFLEMSAPAHLPDDMRPEWLSELSWVRLRDLGKIFPYNKLLPVLFEDEAQTTLTQQYFDRLGEEGADAVEDPHGKVAALTPFQKLVLIRCLQPRAFLSASQIAVKYYLGASCTVAEPVELESAFTSTSPGTPIVLIATTNQPLPQVMTYAEQKGIKVIHMAIGRGQGQAADKVIRASLGQPLWVLLENTHLAGDWMPQLCSLVQALPGMRPHWDFRLWLTTVPTEDFPAVILQVIPVSAMEHAKCEPFGDIRGGVAADVNDTCAMATGCLQTSLKLVMDPPAGLKANLTSVLTTLPPDVLTQSRPARVEVQQVLPSFGAQAAAPAKEPPREVIGSSRFFGPVWRQLVLRLCMFHAILLERRHYRALGWRLPYDFSAADFVAAIKQVLQIHKEFGGVGNQEAELDVINHSLPGLLYVTGQCLYGGKVTHDWDRRLLVCLLEQQLMPGSIPAPPKGLPPSVPTVDLLLPEKIANGNMELNNVGKELRGTQSWEEEPGLVGLTQGAAVVRMEEQTRHALHILKKVQMMQGSADSDSDAAKPLQVAMSVAQDVGRQLPFTVLPTVLSGWALLVSGKAQPPGSQGPGLQPSGRPPPPPHGTEAGESAAAGPVAGEASVAGGSSRAHSEGGALSGGDSGVQGEPSQASEGEVGPHGADAAEGTAGKAAAISPLAALMAARAEKAAARALAKGTTAGPATAAAPRPVNRARQLKMTESMSPAATDRWEKLGEVERKMLIQVFETEMTCYQAVLTTVHASIKMVTAAIKGFEAITGEFQELIRQLSSNEVPRIWASAGPGGVPVELTSESIATWISDLCDRLEWMYQWAVDGPPLVWKLGMMARPKAFLTAIQQIHAARLDCAVGALVWRTHIMTCSELSSEARNADTDGMKQEKLLTSQGQSVSLHEACSSGCLITGVLLQGAQWKQGDGVLGETPSSSIFSSMPLLWLVPLPEQGHSSTAVSSDAPGTTTQRHSVGSTSVRSQSPRSVVPSPEPGLLTGGAAPGGLSMTLGTRLPQQPQTKVSTVSLGTVSPSRLVRLPTKKKQLDQLAGIWDGLQAGEEAEEVEMYVCPVYLYSHKWESKTGNYTDVDDCLFDVLLPPGRHSPQHWVTRNVVLLVCSDPGQLTHMAQ